VAAATAMSPAIRQSLGYHDPGLALTAVAAAYQRRFSPDPVLPPWPPYYAKR